MTLGIFLVSLTAAGLSAMGLGGGTVLLLYLTLFQGVDQLEAQFINLVFFIPIAATAIVIHLKNHHIEKKTALFMICGGLPGVFAGALLSSWLGSDAVAKVFGLLLLAMGTRELFAKKQPRDTQNDKRSPHTKHRRPRQKQK